MSQSCDVAVVGGAVMGSSVAYYLTKALGRAARVVVVEADPSYRTAATALSAGSIRQQFSAAVNVRMSLYGIEFLRRIGETLAVGEHRPDVGLHEGGYLFLADAPGEAVLRVNQAAAAALGADLALLYPQGIEARFPYLATGDVAAASFGVTGEGWFDGYGLMQAFRGKAAEQGASFIEGEVVRVEHAPGLRLGLRDGEELSCGAVVLACGAAVPGLVPRSAIDLPVRARKRMIFTFDCRGVLPDFPMLIDSSGVYCRPEGTGFLCGTSPAPEADPDATDFDVDWSLFEETIWPVLAARVPAFEQIRPNRAWAGHYDLNLFDHNAFIGAVPGIPGLYVATGFSGHGLQQSPAVGRGLAELIAGGRYATLDLADLGCERLLADRPLVEQYVV